MLISLAINWVKVPTDYCEFLMLQDRHAFLLRNLLCETTSQIKKKGKYSWNACCFLIMELKEPLSLLVDQCRIASNLLRIVDLVLRTHPQDILWAIWSALCNFDSSQKHGVIFGFVVAIDVRSA